MSLINELIKDGHLKTKVIIEAFEAIKRKDFLLEEDKNKAEQNTPISIGFGQTISQPLTVAFMIELLDPKPGEKILDVGSGSGWTVALLSYIVGEKGRIFGIEIIETLRSFAESNVNKYKYIEKKIASIKLKDGYEGLPEYSPFDKIIVAAAPEQVPEELKRQLKIGGRMVIPVGRQFRSQDMVVIDRIDKDNYKEKRIPGFVFVPLVKNYNK